jgi:hypothetical protein
MGLHYSMRLLTAAALVSAAALPTPAATASDARPHSSGVLPASVPAAAVIVARMSQRPYVYLLHPVDEGPTTVVRGGLCDYLAELGCRQMVESMDASVMVLASAREAEAYVAHADDHAAQVGRVIISFGTPARVARASQPAYTHGVRTWRREHAGARPDAIRIALHLASRGLPMRNAQLADSRASRLGRAAEIPGAIDMVTTFNADVIVFRSRAAADTYVGNTPDVIYRYRRVVLSFGNPERVLTSQQPRYRRALRAAVG